MERRLAAIMIADVVGYTRLIQADEAGTRVRFRALQKDLFEPSVGSHGGRIIKTMGDAFLLEFPSAVEAVSCAIEVQRELETLETDRMEDQRIQFRIGINVGDIIVEGDDIHGDGVNVAARLEKKSESGGILISGTVHDQVVGKLDIAFEDMGEVEVKNMVRPVRVFRVLLDGNAAPAVKNKTSTRRYRYGAATLVAIVIALYSYNVWFGNDLANVEPAAVERMAHALPDKPSVAVLPFTNLSDDKEQEYFADGMTDDLITDLSKVSGLIVIARNSVFTYKGKNVKAQEVAKDLNVSHVLEGSVRRVGKQIRINAQLIDAKTGAHLWSERFDRAYEDTFKLQDEIASKIVAALEVTLTVEEKTRLARKQTKNLEAYEKYLQARKAHFRFDDKGMMRALRLYAEAIELDPTFVAAYAGDAQLAGYLMRGGQKRLFLKFSTARERSERSFTRALKLDPNNSEAMSVQARNYLIFRTRAEAIAVARKAVASNANDASSHRSLALMLVADGQNTEAKGEIDAALRLDPKLGTDNAAITGWIYYSIGDYEQAIRNYEIAVALLPKVPRGHLGLAMSFAQLGRRAEAKTALENLLKASPRQNLRLAAVWGQHLKKEVLDHRLDGLRKVGLPEWPYGFKPVPANRLSGEEIKAIFIGHHIKGRSGSGLEFDQTTSQSGDAVYKTAYFTLKVENRVEGDELCFRIDGLMFGRWSCIPVYRNPAGSRAELNEFTYANISSVIEFSIVE
jgi:adenylate cyclase